MDEEAGGAGGGRILFGIVAALAAGAAAVGLAWGENDRPASFASADGRERAMTSRISAGTTHTCAVTAGDGVRCWGANADFQLGNGVRTWSRIPVDVIGLATGVRAVSVGGSHSCAVTVPGQVQCWSQEAAALSFPQAPKGSARPVPAQGVGAVSALGTGNGHSCALTVNGAVRCWGVFNRADTSTATLREPTEVPELGQGVLAIGVGYDNQCALTAERAIRCWGQDYERNPKVSVLASVEVAPAGTDATALAVGGARACLVTDAGGVRCWTHPAPGTDLEDGVDLEDVPGLPDGVVSVSVGYNHACALTEEGAAVCWGRNSHGELGNGTTADSEAPTPVVGLRSGVVAVSAGFQHSCALLRDAQALCWGYNFEGQLGNGASTISFTPVPLKVAAPAPPGPPPEPTDPGAPAATPSPSAGP